MVHRRKGSRTRTRTITKTKIRFRNRFAGVRSRFRSRTHSKMDHLALITSGIGTGALVSTGTQMLSKYTGFRYPIWLNPLISGVLGLFVGKHIGHSWAKAGEVAIASAGTAFAEDHIISVSASPRGNVSGGSIQVF